MLSVVIPTYNAQETLIPLLDALLIQSTPFELIIIDSESTDQTQNILKERGIYFHTIPKTEFNHGKTRNIGVSLSTHEHVVFLTQDAIPADSDTLTKILTALSDERVGMAYGRQLPHTGANELSKFARAYHYPPFSQIKSKKDIAVLGIRTCSCSNSFAAYRKSLLTSIGGFPESIIMGEDIAIAAKLILMDYQVSYCAEAKVYHSHDYTIKEEFKRYFDIGTFHEQLSTLLKPFMRTRSEGFNYVLDEWKYLIKKRQFLIIPYQMLKVFAKYVGYRLGRYHRHMPNKINQVLSMHSLFWSIQNARK